MSTFYIKVPGWAHAMLQTGISASDARQAFRRRHGMRRLPAGTTCHRYAPASPL